MSDVRRAAAMADSVKDALLAIGVAPDGVDLVCRAHALAMEARIEQLEDDHHTAYLHPGRSVLILVRDVAHSDPPTLAASALLESETDALRVPALQISSQIGPDVVSILEQIPAPGDEALVERLVTLPEALRLVALAERLDQLRHAHLHPDRAWWAVIHEETTRAWLPVAERTHARLAQRYRHWQRTFARRL